MAFNVAVSGASGFIGLKLCQKLKERGYVVWPLVRQKKALPHEILYDYEQGYIELEKLAHCHAVINLSGKNVAAGLWTKSYKKELYDSRIKSTRLLAESLARLRHGPSILLNASAIGIYGDKADQKLDESSKTGHDFLARLCEDWEAETEVASLAGVRVVNMRFGHVLAGDGGFLKKQLPFFKLGLGLGFPDQYLSLVTREELIEQIIFLLNHPLMGPVNMVGLRTTSLEFAESLSQVLHKKIWARPPKFLLNSLGEQGRMLTTSSRVYPKKLMDAGFNFSKQELLEVLEEEVLGE